MQLTRAIALIFAVLGLSGCVTTEHSQQSSIEEAAVGSIGGTYTFGVAEGPLLGCRVTLEATPVGRAAGHTTRSVSFSSSCRERFAVLRAVRQWAWISGGSIAFFGGEPFRELSDFSPVQDGTGVYLRGGFERDTGIYELRQPDQ
jgi:hypothetical protein